MRTYEGARRRHGGVATPERLLAARLGWLPSTRMITPMIAGADTPIVAVLTGIGALGSLAQLSEVFWALSSRNMKARRYVGRIAQWGSAFGALRQRRLARFERRTSP